MEEGIAWLAETSRSAGSTSRPAITASAAAPIAGPGARPGRTPIGRQGYAESWSHADMADFYPRLYDAALAKRPDAWIYSEIQWDNLLDAEAMHPLRTLPEGGIYQHTTNRSYWNRVDGAR